MAKANHTIRLLLPLSLLAATGCSYALNSKFTATAPYERSKRTPEQVEIFLRESPPSQPHTSVGIMEIILDSDAFSKSVPSNTELLSALRAAAAKNGLDGVRDVVFPPHGTYGYGTASGVGFVYAR